MKPGVDDAGSFPPAHAAVDYRQISAWRQGQRSVDVEAVAEEVPVALVYNGISHAVMLASPQDLEDFAFGFSLCERIIGHRSELYDIEVVDHPQGIEVQIQIASGAMANLKSARRMRTGKTGCGLCGIESLAQFHAELPHVPAGAVVTPAGLDFAMAALATRQPLHQATGSVHAAGWANQDGELRVVREDVGRHNALDKLIGALIRSNANTADGFAVVTSRASFEMVQKSVQAGITLLAAVSAPTAMAVRMAEQAGMSLAGFVRPGRHVVYAGGERIVDCGGVAAPDRPNVSTQQVCVTAS